MLMPNEIQKSSKVGDVNSPALSTRMVRIGYFGNCARRRRICASIRGNIMFCVASRLMLDHLEDASIIGIKYRNGPLGGLMGPHTSA